MKLLYFFCAFEQLPTSLAGFQHITLRQDTKRIINTITLRRHGLLQRLAQAREKSLLLFQTAQMEIAGTPPKAKLRSQMLGVRQRMKKPAGQRRAGGQSWHHFRSRTSQCKRRHNKNLALDQHKDCKTAWCYRKLGEGNVGRALCWFNSCAITVNKE